MKKAVVLHGMPEESEYQHAESQKHWIPWVKEKLEEQGFEVFTPELPRPFAPVYEDWLAVVKQFPIDQDTILIGHSCGAGFLVRYLSENSVRVGKIVLVAPYLDADKDHIPEFFDFALKADLVNQTAGVTIFISTDDDWDIQESTKIISKGCKGTVVRKFKDKGHFCFSDMGTREFPELLETIIH